MAPYFKTVKYSDAEIRFSGAVDLNSTTANAATAATAWFNTVAASPSGSFVGTVNNGDAVSMSGATPWSFNSGALANFWSVDGFTFNLISSSIYSQVGGFLNVSLAGTVVGNGFTATAFNGTFQVADPAAHKHSLNGFRSIPFPMAARLLCCSVSAFWASDCFARKC